MNTQLIEIASWQIVSEIQRRYSGKFKVIETHPGGGQYDCLSLFDNKLGHIADINRNGRFHVFRRFDDMPLPEPLDLWKEMFDSPNPKLILDEICHGIGLHIPRKLPPGNPTVLVYRFIAHFLKYSVLGIDKWECRNGFFDTSGYGGGLVADFQFFPEAQERLQISLPNDISNEPAYRFWFLRKDDIPVICLETNGLCWTKSRKSYELMKLYQQNSRHIWPLIGEIAINI